MRPGDHARGSLYFAGPLNVVQLPPLHEWLHVAPATHSKPQPPPSQLSVQVAPAAQWKLHDPPAHVLAQLVPGSHQISHLPEAQLLAQVAPLSQTYLQTPGAQVLVHVPVVHSHEPLVPQAARPVGGVSPVPTVPGSIALVAVVVLDEHAGMANEATATAKTNENEVVTRMDRAPSGTMSET